MATCYWPNGAVHEIGTPCDPSSEEATPCCESTHTCLSNGLCFDTQNNHVIRVSCTDQTWRDARCPQLCLDNRSDGLGDLRQCDGGNGKWVCGLNVTDCVSPLPAPLDFGFVNDLRPRSENQIMNAGPATSTTTTGGSAPAASSATQSSKTLSSSSTPTSSSSMLATTNAATTCAASASDSSDQVRTVGLGAGLGVGLPLLFALAVVSLLLWQARKELKAMRQDAATATETYQATFDGPNALSPATAFAASPQFTNSSPLYSDSRKYGVLAQDASMYGAYPPSAAGQHPGGQYPHQPYEVPPTEMDTAREVREAPAPVPAGWETRHRAA